MINQQQVQGENFHLVGHTMTFNPMSPPPPPNAYGTGTSQPVKQGSSINNTVHIDIDKEETNEAKRGGKKRFWTHDEETRLVITDHFFFLFVGQCLVQYLICSSFFISYFVGQCLVECFKRPN